MLIRSPGRSRGRDVVHGGEQGGAGRVLRIGQMGVEAHGGFYFARVMKFHGEVCFAKRYEFGCILGDREGRNKQIVHRSTPKIVTFSVSVLAVDTNNVETPMCGVALWRFFPQEVACPLAPLPQLWRLRAPRKLTVSSHTFKLQRFRVRVSNSSISACLDPKCTAEFEARESGSIFRIEIAEACLGATQRDPPPEIRFNNLNKIDLW